MAADEQPVPVQTHRWSLSKGVLIVQYPNQLTEDEYQEICDLLDLIQRAAKRNVLPDSKTPPPSIAIKLPTAALEEARK